MHRAIHTMLGAVAGLYAGAALGFATFVLFAHSERLAVFDMLEGFFMSAGVGIAVGAVLGAALMAWQTRELDGPTAQQLRERGEPYRAQPHPAANAIGIVLAVFFVGVLIYVIALPLIGGLSGDDGGGVLLGVMVVLLALTGGVIIYAVTRFLSTRNPPPMSTAG